VDAGAPPELAAVIPPFHHIGRLLDLPPDETVLRTYPAGETLLLMVGRLVPNKNHASLLEAFAHYRRHTTPEAGSSSSASWTNAWEFTRGRSVVTRWNWASPMPSN